MLQIITTTQKLDFSQLMNVYRQSNSKIEAICYPKLDEMERRLEIEQDQYAFVREFLRAPKSFIAVWSAEGVYHAALRVEPYSDGMLLEGVETSPDSRRQGYAKRLVQATVKYLAKSGKCRLYSHVSKKNTPSIALHKSCGFLRLYDHAVFIDGSVDQNTFTYYIDINNEGADV